MTLLRKSNHNGGAKMKLQWLVWWWDYVNHKDQPRDRYKGSGTTGLARGFLSQRQHKKRINRAKGKAQRLARKIQRRNSR
jgi:hypothetical protein